MPQGASKTLIVGSTYEQLPISIYESGAKLSIHQYQRDIPQVKTTNYLFSAALSEEMKKGGFIDVLFHRDSLITECSRCNFFLVVNDEIKTPAKNILEGITRHRVLTQKGLPLPITETDIQIDMLSHATEAFITSTTKGVLPIVGIGDMTIKNGMVGPVTKQLMSLINVF